MLSCDDANKIQTEFSQLRILKKLSLRHKLSTYRPSAAAIVTLHLVLLEIQTFCESPLRNTLYLRDTSQLNKKRGNKRTNAHFSAPVQGFALALWHSTVSENQF